MRRIEHNRKISDHSPLLHNIGSTLVELHLYPEAIQYLRASQRDSVKWGTDHTLKYCNTLVNLGYCYLQEKKKYSKARIYYFLSIGLQNNLLKVLAPYSSANKLSIFKSMGFQVVQSFLQFLKSPYIRPKDLIEGYLQLEFFKNLSNSRQQNRVGKKSSKTIRELRSISEAFSELAIGKCVTNNDKWNLLIKRYEELSAELSVEQTNRPGTFNSLELSLSHITNRLAPDTAVIDFYYTNTGSESGNTGQYTAFVITNWKERGVEVDLIVINDAAHINHLISELTLANVATDDDGYVRWHSLSNQLYQLLIKPLLNSVSIDPGIGKLLIVPDRTLASLQFEQLIDDNDILLVEKFHISYALSARSGLYYSSMLTNGIRKCVVISNPRFSVSPPSETQFRSIVRSDDSDKYSAQASTSNAGFTTNFTPLPASELEGKWIHNTLTQSHFKVVHHSGIHATKQSFFRIQSPTILHIATHGFFYMIDTQSDANGRTTDIEYNRAITPKEFLSQSAKCGIVFSGVNDWLESGSSKPHHGNGIVTASEIEHTENICTGSLVFLSGCNTGLGTLRIHESPIGLIRSFLKAGANSVVAVVQPLPDRISFQAVQKFYQNLLFNESIAVAFHEMQIELIRDAREMTGVPHPKLWSGFILYNTSTN